MTFPVIEVGQVIEISDRKYVFGRSSAELFNKLGKFLQEKSCDEKIKDVILKKTINFCVGEKLPTDRFDYVEYENIIFGDILAVLGVEV